MAENKDFFKEKGSKPSEFQKVAKSYREGWAYAEYAIQYGVAIVLCSLIGYWLDKWLNTGITFLVIGVIFGSVGGFVILLRSLGVIKYNKDKGNKDTDKKGDGSN
jgi:F0F1-type ATP synthase assembly protein I